jgi:phosphatidylglycerophosphate synthase
MRRFGRTLAAIAIGRASIGLAILIYFDPTDPASASICLLGFAVGLASDHADGLIARKYSVPTITGYLQDAVSDKLLHIASLLALSKEFELLAITVWLVVARELIILSVRVVSPQLITMLKQFKWQSLVYAGLLRAGLICFFLLSCFRETSNNELLIVVSYVILNSGVAFGLLEQIPRKASRRGILLRGEC